MTNNYRAAQMNRSPRANYGRNTAYSSRQTAPRGVPGNAGTYMGNANVNHEGGLENNFFPSGYVYSSQNSATPTGYFYGNVPQQERSIAASLRTPAAVGGAGQKSGNNGARQAVQSPVYGGAGQTGQSSSSSGAGQNGQSNAMNARMGYNAPGAARANPQNANGANRFNRVAGVPNRAATRQQGGLFGGIGGMVKGILGEDPLGSIGKVVNIMKMLG